MSSSTESWLSGVLSIGGHTIAPPSPAIPAEYRQRPRRYGQRPALKANTQLPSPAADGSTNEATKLCKHPIHTQTLATPVGSKRRGRGNKTIVDVVVAEDADVELRPARVTRRRELQHTVTPSLTPGASVDNADTRPNLDRTEEASVASSATSKSRARSPTKRMVDLRVAQKKVESKTASTDKDVPEDVRMLYNAIMDLADSPSGTIPLEVASHVETANARRLPPALIATTPDPLGRDLEMLVDEFKELRKIRDATSKCKTKHLHEPSWNSLVHGPILAAAVLPSPGLECYDITTAHVIKELLPENKYGELLKNKMIDYAIILQSPLISEDAVISRLNASPRGIHRTINCSDYSPLCHEPVAISIETKSLDGITENGEVQLSIWALASFARLQVLSSDPVGITLLLILVSDEHWALKFAVDKEDCVDIVDVVTLGETGTLAGSYKVLRGLRVLAEWAEVVFSMWLKNNILQPE